MHIYAEFKQDLIIVNFIKLSKSQEYNNILVVIDRFFKESAFISYIKEKIIIFIAKLFKNYIWYQYGLFKSIVFD